MGTLTRGKVLELRDQFVRLAEANCVAAVQFQYVLDRVLGPGDFAEYAPEMLEKFNPICRTLGAKMDPGNQWQKTMQPSIWNECLNNDEFMSVARMATPRPAVIELFQVPYWFSVSPITFNFQVVWESARFLLFLPGLTQQHLREWATPGKRNAGLFDEANIDTRSVYLDAFDILQRIEKIHEWDRGNGRESFQEILLNEFAAIERECPAEAESSDSAGQSPGSPEMLLMKQIKEITEVDDTTIRRCMKSADIPRVGQGKRDQGYTLADCAKIADAMKDYGGSDATRQGGKKLEEHIKSGEKPAKNRQTGK